MIRTLQTTTRKSHVNASCLGWVRGNTPLAEPFSTLNLTNAAVKLTIFDWIRFGINCTWIQIPVCGHSNALSQNTIWALYFAFYHFKFPLGKKQSENRNSTWNLYLALSIFSLSLSPRFSLHFGAKDSELQRL